MSVNMNSLFGIDILVSPDRPAYVLPEDLPLPDDFRKEFNDWAARFFKPKNEVPDGEAFILNGKTVLMNPRTFHSFKLETAIADSLNRGFMSLKKVRKREAEETKFRFPVS